jgi:hypothetical protein
MVPVGEPDFVHVTLIHAAPVPSGKSISHEGSVEIVLARSVNSSHGPVEGDVNPPSWACSMRLQDPKKVNVPVTVPAKLNCKANALASSILMYQLVLVAADASFAMRWYAMRSLLQGPSTDLCKHRA